MATTTSSLSLSGNLPPRLMNFFAKYPPKLYAAKYTGASIPLTRPQRASLRSRAPLSAPSASMPSVTSTVATAPMLESTSTPPPEHPSFPSAPPANDAPPNPFLPWRNPETGRWRAPHFSLRRQADLVKAAQRYGVESLLPPSRKSSAFKEARLLEKGLRVKGTGEGQRVKGHKWERKMPAKLEARKKAMEGMPAMIRAWKEVRRYSPLRGALSWMMLMFVTARFWKEVEDMAEAFLKRSTHNLYNAQIYCSTFSPASHAPCGEQNCARKIVIPKVNASTPCSSIWSGS